MQWSSLRTSIDARGYALAERALDPAEVDSLTRACERLPGKAFGTRRALELDALRVLATDRLAPLVRALIADDALLVRGLAFDKSTDTNWALAWHRDQQIAVKDGRGDGAILEGIPHVPASRAVLDAMIALRVHLDDCDAETGALVVSPGSHQDDGDWSDAREATTISARAGDVLLMRPTLLHRSSRATRPGARRRVLHFEYASGPLAPPLAWFVGLPLGASGT